MLSAQYAEVIKGSTDQVGALGVVTVFALHALCAVLAFTSLEGVPGQPIASAHRALNVLLVFTGQGVALGPLTVSVPRAPPVALGFTPFCVEGAVLVYAHRA